MTQKTRSQIQQFIGAYDHEEFQQDVTDSAWFKDEIASQAEAEAGAATNKLMTPERTAQAIAALGGGGGLSDYQNVVVVDAGGNGDFATVGEALASVSDAASDNRYAVICFGDIHETGNIVTKGYVDIIGMGGSLYLEDFYFQVSGSLDAIRIANLRFAYNGPNLEFLSTANAIFTNCDFGQTRIYGVSGGSAKFYSCINVNFDTIDGETLEFYNCQFATTVQILVDNVLTTNLLFCNCKFPSSSSSYPAIYRVTGLTVKFISSYFDDTRTAGAGYGLVINGTGGVVELHNCVCVAKGHASSRGLSIATGADAPLIAGGYYEGGGTNLAIYSASVLAAAPFYQATFKGGTTNVTCNAGTANGTCVNF